MVCGSSQNTQNTEDFMANMDMPELEDPSPSVAKVLSVTQAFGVSLFVCLFCLFFFCCFVCVCV